MSITKIKAPYMKGGFDDRYYVNGTTQDALFFKDYINYWASLTIQTSPLNYKTVLNEDYNKVIKIHDDLYIRIKLYAGDVDTPSEPNFNESGFWNWSYRKSVFIEISNSENMKAPITIGMCQTSDSDSDFGYIGQYNSGTRTQYQQLYAIQSGNGDAIFCVHCGVLDSELTEITSFSYPIFAIVHTKSEVTGASSKAIIGWSPINDGVLPSTWANSRKRYPWLSTVNAVKWTSGYTPVTFYDKDTLYACPECDIKATDALSNDISNWKVETIGTYGIDNTDYYNNSNGIQSMLSPAWSINSTYQSTYAKLISFSPTNFDGSFAFDGKNYYAVHGLALLDD